MSDDNEKKTEEKKVAVVPKAKPSEKADIAAKNTDKHKAGEYVLREGNTWRTRGSSQRASVRSASRCRRQVG